MKMIAVLCALALCNVFVGGHAAVLRNGFLGVEEPAASAGEQETPPLDGPAHSDNFQDEIVDQADPEFDMIAGDGEQCMSWEALEATFNEQFEEDQEDGYDPTSLSDAEKAENEQIKAGMLEDLRTCYDHADTNEDGCVNKAEFKAAGEMEGAPPGFQANQLEEMSPEELNEQTLQEDEFMFAAMDKNNDGKISKSESYDYTSGGMPAADINSDDLDEMFNEADTSNDGFLTFEEFRGAGQEIEGDGNEMENAVPMPTSPPTPMAGGISFKVFMSKRKIAKVRVEVTKKMLAHKPPLKFMSHLLNRRK